MSIFDNLKNKKYYIKRACNPFKGLCLLDIKIKSGSFYSCSGKLGISSDYKSNKWMLTLQRGLNLFVITGIPIPPEQISDKPTFFICIYV